MRIYKTKWFHKWAAKEAVSDAALRRAVAEMERGLVEADLGGQVFKKRIATAGRGKSGSVRTLIAFQIGHTAFFVYGFAKNARANIDDKELKALKMYAHELLNYTVKQIAVALSGGALIEVDNDE